MAGSPKDETDEAAEAFGIKLPDSARPQREQQHEALWPENVWAARLFESMSTQWRAGPGGIIGLDYNVRDAQADQIRLPRRERRDAYEALREMEFEGLTYFSELRK